MRIFLTKLLQCSWLLLFSAYELLMFAPKTGWFQETMCFSILHCIVGMDELGNFGHLTSLLSRIVQIKDPHLFRFWSMAFTFLFIIFFKWSVTDFEVMSLIPLNFN